MSIIYCSRWYIHFRFCGETHQHLEYYNNHSVKAKLKGLSPALHRPQALFKHIRKIDKISHSGDQLHFTINPLRYNPSCSPKMISVIIFRETRYFYYIASMRCMDKLTVAYIKTCVANITPTSRRKKDNIPGLKAR